MQGVELPAAVQLSQSLVIKISDVAKSARSAPVELEIFIQLACYLERVVPICIELQRGRDSSPMIHEILDALIREVDSADDLIKQCSSKSKIYLITHLRPIAKQLETVVHDIGRSLSLIPQSSVQGNEDTKAVIDSLSRDMQQAHFEIKETDDRICQFLTEDSIILQNDPDVQADFLLDIAKSVGIEDAPRNPNALKLQVQLLKNDLRGTTEPHDLQMMDLLGNLVENWTETTTINTESPIEESSHAWEQRRVEPVYESFVCPLSKTIMRDPVTLETGQTYERTAIEKWFRDCKENGKPLVCPMTGKELESTVLKPSIALRQTIEEWRTRNEAARIDNAGFLISSKASQQDILHGLKDIQQIVHKNRLNKYKVRNSGLIPIIAGCLKHGEQVRHSALITLRALSEDEDENKEAIGKTDAIRNCIKCLSRDLPKEQEEAAALLYELSKFQPLCERIGSESGAILVLVGVVSSGSINSVTVEKAEKTLQNLESIDPNVREMAVNGRLQPLLKRLVEGGEEVRLEMATLLSDLVLSKEGKIKAAQVGGEALVSMLESGYLAGREAALKCLCQLSDIESNGKVLATAGILGPLTKDLFVVGVNQLPMKLKEVSATTLANVVSLGVDLENVKIDEDGNTLISEPILHNLLHLVCNTGPAIQAKLLQVLVALASSPRAADKVVAAIKSAGAMLSLIQFLEAPQKDLRANSIKLLYHLCDGMGQELADNLRVTTGQLNTLVKILDMSGVSEEQSAAAGLLAKLPTDDTQLTRALMNEGVLPIIVRKLDELRHGIVRVGTGRFLSEYKEGLVGILSRFTYVSNDPGMVKLAQEYNLAFAFTTLLKKGDLDEILRWSAVALANLSVYSKHLSVVPEVKEKSGCCAPWFKRKAPQTLELCVVHSGLCSAKETFCLLDCQAVQPLVTCLDHPNLGVMEAALKALSTLVVDAQNLEGGIKILNAAEAIKPILDIMKEHRTEALQQHAVTIVECILQNDDVVRFISNDATVHTSLVEAYKHGNASTRRTAEKALKLLNKIPTFSGGFVKMK